MPSHVKLIQKPPGVDIGVDDEGNPNVFRLLRAVYGLKQSPSCWNDLIDKWLKTEAPGNLTQNPYDRCFFHAWRGDDFFLLGFHVDDFLIVTTDEAWEKEFMTAISSRFEVKDMGALGEPIKDKPGEKLGLLGLQVDRDLEKGTIKLYLEKYLKGALDLYNMTGTRPTTTPANEPKSEDMVPGKDEYDARGWNPSRVVGKFLWAATKVRPDLSVITSVLGSERHDPSVAGVKNTARMMSYVAGTLDMGLTYRSKVTNTADRRTIKLTEYCDSDWVGDIKLALDPTCRSRGAFLIFAYDGDLVHHRTGLRPSVDTSSTTAELGALSDGQRRLTWLKRLLVEAGFKVPTIDVYEDNKAAIILAESHGITERMRHMHARDRYVREFACGGTKEIKIHYIKSAENLADFLTKILSPSMFRTFRDRIMRIVN